MFDYDDKLRPFIIIWRIIIISLYLFISVKYILSFDFNGVYDIVITIIISIALLFVMMFATLYLSLIMSFISFSLVGFFAKKVNGLWLWVIAVIGVLATFVILYFISKCGCSKNYDVEYWDNYMDHIIRF